MIKIERALISVTDKTGLTDLAQGLADFGVEIVSTGGTAGVIREAGVEVIDVAQVTGFPEMLDGRVKTLHPKIHAGILARRDLQSHMDQLAEAGIEPIDLVVVNLYQFEEAVSDPKCKLTRGPGEHRHRRAVSHPGRGQELDRHGGGRRPDRLQGLPGRDESHRRLAEPAHPLAAG